MANSIEWTFPFHLVRTEILQHVELNRNTKLVIQSHFRWQKLEYFVWMRLSHILSKTTQNWNNPVQIRDIPMLCEIGNIEAISNDTQNWLMAMSFWNELNSSSSYFTSKPNSTFKSSQSKANSTRCYADSEWKMLKIIAIRRLTHLTGGTFSIHKS